MTPSDSSRGRREDTTAENSRPVVSPPKKQRNTGALTVEATSAAPPRPQPEANLIVLAHPDPSALGVRYRLSPGARLEIGRSPELDISFPEQLSVSRKHARLSYVSSRVLVEDLGSLNGTFVNDRLVDGQVALVSGDRVQIGKVHLKFLHEQDVEHAYHEAIYQMVIRDGLTELYNRRKFDEALETEFARARRHDRPLSLVVFDIDLFKEVNDRFGHLGGDAVLKRLATVAKGQARIEQVLARIGGEEFALVCPETPAAGALQLAERLRELVAAQKISFATDEISVTCSFGVAALDASIDSPENLFVRADRALYRAKETGRNRVVEG